MVNKGGIVMINIAICDDELYVTEQMQSIIIKYQNERSEDIQCDIFHNGECLLMADKEYEIIFLDIYMSGMNGIETAKVIRTKDKTVEIIYLTSYIGLTKEALSVHAFEYLEKPIKKEEIFFQLDEVIARLLNKKVKEEHRYQIMEFIAGKTKIRLILDDIYYFERADRKIYVVTKEGTFNLYETIESIEKRLHQYEFVRSHQSFVVNINNIKDYVKDEIVMINNDTIPLAQKRASEFKKIMRVFLKKKLENKL